MLLIIGSREIIIVYLFYLTYRTAKAELERVSAEESSAREERNKFERNLTMVQHDMKENQRKLELEIEHRQKAEAKLSEVESQLQTEMSAHQAARGNSQQSVEKVQQLEKQVGSDSFVFEAFCILQQHQQQQVLV